MLMQAIDNYLRLRRAAGYQLRYTEVLLKEFACFATERGEIHIKSDTAIAWAGCATSLQERARRLNSLILFAASSSWVALQMPAAQADASREAVLLRMISK